MSIKLVNLERYSNEFLTFKFLKRNFELFSFVETTLTRIDFFELNLPFFIQMSSWIL